MLDYRLADIYNLLARLDAFFLPLNYGTEDIFESEENGSSKYRQGSERVVASYASIAVVIKSTLGAPLLTGTSETQALSASKFLQKFGKDSSAE